MNNMTQNWTNLTKTLRRKSKSAWSLRIKSGKTSAEGGGSGSTASQLVSALGNAIDILHDAVLLKVETLGHVRDVHKS